MEELLNNFSGHLSKIVSPGLGAQIQNYIQDVYLSQYPEESDIIEHDVKTIISKYLKKLDEDDMMKISENLYNCYIDNDDENLIQAIKIFVRFYSKFEEIKMKNLFYRWRINILYQNLENENSRENREIIIKKENKNIKNTNKKNLSKERERHEGETKNYKEYKDFEKTNLKNNINSMSEQNTRRWSSTRHESSNSVNNEGDKNCSAKNRKNSNSNTNSNLNLNLNSNVTSFPQQKNYVYNTNKQAEPMNIFDKLYLNSYKKQDEKLMNAEIRKIAELEECTFKPKVNKKKI
jgi:hypothetical protein